MYFVNISSSCTCSTFQSRCHWFGCRFSQTRESDPVVFSSSIFSLSVFLFISFIRCLNCITCTFSSLLMLQFFFPNLLHEHLYYLKINEKIMCVVGCGIDQSFFSSIRIRYCYCLDRDIMQMMKLT